MLTRKNIIPAAIVAAFAGAAQAQVSIYGLIDMSYGKNDFVADEKATLHSGGNGGGAGGDYGNSTTRVGIKGSNDVGSGIKANFKLETSGIDDNGEVGSGSGTFFGRQMWLGFSGGFGEVRLGRQDSVPFQVMGNFDFNGQSNGATSAWSGIGVWATDRQSRSIQYMSPDMSGLKLHAGYQPENADKTDNDRSVASVAALYTRGALQVGAAYESKHTRTSKDFASVAASYDLKFVKVMAGYTTGETVFMGALNAISNTPDATKVAGPTIGVVAPVAGFNVGAHYAKDTKNDKDAVLEVFVNKEVLKNTYGYAEFARRSSDQTVTGGMTEVQKKDGDDSFAVGVIYVF